MQVFERKPSFCRGGIRLEVVLPILVVALIGLVVALALRDRRPQSRPSDGDALAVRLVGIWPDGSDDFYDAKGNQVGKRFFPADDWPSSTNQMWRVALLEIDTTNDLLSTSIEAQIDTGRYRMSTSTSGSELLSTGNVQRLFVSFNMQRTIRHHTLPFLRSRQRPVGKIDLTLRYLPADAADHPQVRFEGPFQVKRTVAKGGIELTPLAEENRPGWKAAAFQIKSPHRKSFWDLPMIVEQTDGTRTAGSIRSSRSSPAGSQYEISTRGVSLKDVAAVMICEMHSKTFRDVQIHYPERPLTDQPEHIARLAEALQGGLSATGAVNLMHFRHHHFRSPDEAIKVIDIVRGDNVGRAWRALEYPQGRRSNSPEFSDLPVETQEKLRRAARTWVEHGNREQRRAGLQMGANGNWPEFIDLALGWLQDDSFDDRYAAAHALEKVSNLDAEQLRTIGKVLKEESPPNAGFLIRCLARHPGTGAEIVLELTADDRPWIWWRAMEALPGIPPASELTPKLQRRLVLARGERYVPSKEAATAAYEQLPELFLSDLWRRDSSVHGKVYDRIVRHLDRERATELIVEYLGKSDPKWNQWMTARMLRQLNQWHGRDFGQLGADPVKGHYPTEETYDWGGAVSEAVRWHQAGAKNVSEAARDTNGNLTNP